VFNFHAEEKAAFSAFGEGAKRLDAALHHFGVPVAPIEVLRRELTFAFCEADFLFARTLLNQTTDVKWYGLILVGKDTSLDRHYDPVTLGPSLAEVMGFFLEQSDSLRIPVTRVTAGLNEYTFYNNIDKIAVIKQIPFSKVPVGAVARADNALRGVRLHEVTRAAARLSKAFGVDVSAEQYRRSRIAPVAHRTPGNLATALRKMLAETFSVDVRKHIAQEATAAMFGAPSWHVFVANSELPIGRGRPIISFWNGEQTDRDDFQLYPDISEATAAFVHQLRMRPGLKCRISHGLRDTLFMAADNPNDETHTVGSLGVVSVDQASEHYIRTATEILSTPDPVGALHNLLGITDPLAARWRSANRRMNIDSKNELFMGNWLFTLRRFDVDDHVRLYGERSNMDGAEAHSFATPVYKTEMRRTEEGSGYSLFGEYGRECIAQFPEFTDRQIRRLVEFSGVTLWPRSL
jgi:hypothetical protein